VDNSTEYHYDWAVTYCKPILLQLTEGSHTVAVKVSSGDLTFCANVTFTVNVVSPYLSVLPSENIEDLSSEVPLDLKYNFTEIPVGYFFTSSVVPLNFVTFEASGFSYSLDGDDRVSFVGNVTLKGGSDGVHSVVLYGKAVDGSDFASEPFSVWVDTGKPRIAFLSLQNDTTYRTWNVDLAFRLSEPSPAIKYTLYGNNQVQTAVIDGNNSFFNLPSGSYTLVLSAKDSVSNFISFQRVDFRVDNPLPLIVVVVASVIIIVVGLLVYFKKRKH
jgi:hypothetical protein